MKFRYLLLLATTATTPVQALDADHLLSDLAWEKRVLLIFSPHDRRADFRRQVALLNASADGLDERDMTTIEAFADDRLRIDGREREPAATGFYRRFAVRDDEFRVILLGKDGTIKLDRDAPVTSRDLFALIDAMPMRRLEMRRNG